MWIEAEGSKEGGDKAAKWELRVSADGRRGYFVPAGITDEEAEELAGEPIEERRALVVQGGRIPGLEAILCHVDKPVENSDHMLDALSYAVEVTAQRLIRSMDTPAYVVSKAGDSKNPHLDYLRKRVEKRRRK